MNGWRVIVFDPTRFHEWYSSAEVSVDRPVGLERYVLESKDVLAQAFSVRAEHAERVVDMMNGVGRLIHEPTETCEGYCRGTGSTCSQEDTKGHIERLYKGLITCQQCGLVKPRKGWSKGCRGKVRVVLR